MERQDDPVLAICVNSDSIFVGSEEQTAIQFSIRTGECIRVFSGGAVTSLCVDGHWLFSGSRNGVAKAHRIDGTGQELEFGGHSAAVTCLCADGRRLFTGSADHSVIQWDIVNLNARSTPRQMRRFQGHSGDVSAVCCSGNKLFTASHDMSVRAWSAIDGQCTSVMRSHQREVLCLTMRGNVDLFSGSRDRTVRHWRDGVQVGLFSGFHSAAITDVCCAGSDSLFSASEDTTACLWKISDGSCVRTFVGHLQAVTCCAIGAGNFWTGSTDGRTRAWPLEPQPSSAVQGSLLSPSKKPTPRAKPALGGKAVRFSDPARGGVPPSAFVRDPVLDALAYPWTRWREMVMQARLVKRVAVRASPSPSSYSSSRGSISPVPPHRASPSVLPVPNRRPKGRTVASDQMRQSLGLQAGLSPPVLDSPSTQLRNEVQQWQSESLHEQKSWQDSLHGMQRSRTEAERLRADVMGLDELESERQLQLAAEQAHITSSIQQLSQELDRVRGNAKADQASYQRELAELRERLEAAQATQVSLQADAHTSAIQSEVLQSHMLQAQGQVRASMDVQAAEIARLQSDLREARAQLELKQTEIGSLKLKANQSRGVAASAEGLSGDLRAELERHHTNALEQMATENELRNELNQSNSARYKAEARLKENELTLDQLTEDLAGLIRQREATCPLARDHHEQEQREISKLNQEKSVLTGKLLAQQNSIDALQAQLSKGTMDEPIFTELSRLRKLVRSMEHERAGFEEALALKEAETARLHADIARAQEQHTSELQQKQAQEERAVEAVQLQADELRQQLDELTKEFHIEVAKKEAELSQKEQLSRELSKERRQASKDIEVNMSKRSQLQKKLSCEQDKHTEDVNRLRAECERLSREMRAAEEKRLAEVNLSEEHRVVAEELREEQEAQIKEMLREHESLVAELNLAKELHKADKAGFEASNARLGEDLCLTSKNLAAMETKNAVLAGELAQHKEESAKEIKTLATEFDRLAKQLVAAQERSEVQQGELHNAKEIEREHLSDLESRTEEVSSLVKEMQELNEHKDKSETEVVKELRAKLKASEREMAAASSAKAALEKRIGSLEQRLDEERKRGTAQLEAQIEQEKARSEAEKEKFKIRYKQVLLERDELLSAGSPQSRSQIERLEAENKKLNMSLSKAVDKCQIDTNGLLAERVALELELESLRAELAAETEMKQRMERIAEQIHTLGILRHVVKAFTVVTPRRMLERALRGWKARLKAHHQPALGRAVCKALGRTLLSSIGLWREAALVGGFAQWLTAVLRGKRRKPQTRRRSSTNLETSTKLERSMRPTSPPKRVPVHKGPPAQVYEL